jgi:hypothetical protein
VRVLTGGSIAIMCLASHGRPLSYFFIGVRFVPEYRYAIQFPSGRDALVSTGVFPANPRSGGTMSPPGDRFCSMHWRSLIISVFIRFWIDLARAPSRAVGGLGTLPAL